MAGLGARVAKDFNFYALGAAHERGDAAVKGLQSFAGGHGVVPGGVYGFAHEALAAGLEDGGKPAGGIAAGHGQRDAGPNGSRGGRRTTGHSVMLQDFGEEVEAGVIGFLAEVAAVVGEEVECDKMAGAMAVFSAAHFFAGEEVVAQGLGGELAVVFFLVNVVWIRAPGESGGEGDGQLGGFFDFGDGHKFSPEFKTAQLTASCEILNAKLMVELLFKAHSERRSRVSDFGPRH